MGKNKIILLIGTLIYFGSFFLPTIQFSLGVQLTGWESVLIQWSEILIVSNTYAYFQYLFIALTNFWVIGLIVGGFTVEHKRIKVLLAGLSFVSVVSFLFLFNDNSVILYGYYIWSLSVCLIIIGRFLNK